MTMSSGTSNIAAALAAFQAKIPTVTKTKQATIATDKGRYSYTYAGLPDVTATVLPRLTECDLSFTACPTRNDDGSYSLVGVLLHTSGEWMTGALPLHGRTPQELGSSITYARRYLLGSMTGIVTDDDDDAQAAQGAPPAHAQPTELEVAQHQVQQAWMRWRGGPFDFRALQDDFAQRYGGQDIGAADIKALRAYADTLHQEADEERRIRAHEQKGEQQ